MRALPPAASQFQIVKERLTAVAKFFMEELFKTFKKAGREYIACHLIFLALLRFAPPDFSFYMYIITNFFSFVNPFFFIFSQGQVLL